MPPNKQTECGILEAPIWKLLMSFRPSFGPFTRLKVLLRQNQNKPTASEVLTAHLSSRHVLWTSYFVRYADVVNDQFGWTCFNWKSHDGKNYQILRTGCYPYMKYHCSLYEEVDVSAHDKLMRFIKVLNLGIATLAYGTSARFLITCREEVVTDKGSVTIFFLYPEDYSSMH